MAETFYGPTPPPPPQGRVQIVDEEGRATQAFADWLAKLIYFLGAPKIRRVQETWDPVSLGPNQASPIRVLPLLGAQVGDEVVVTFSQPTQGIIMNGWISAADQLSFQFFNPRSATIDLPSGLVRLRSRTLD